MPQETQSPSVLPKVDLHNEDEVRAYFAYLERECPQLVEAMRVLNISYQQYLAAVRALNQQSSFSTSSTQLML